MSNFLEFTVPLKPVGTSRFALLQDDYLKGGYRIVDSESERDQLDAITLKRGMLVYCSDSGIFWRASNIEFEEDEFGDPIIDVDWEEFNFSSEKSEDRIGKLKLLHASFTVNLTNSMDGFPIIVSKDLKCYSFFMFNFRVTNPVKVEIFSKKDKSDINPYTFIAKHNHLVDDGRSFVKKGVGSSEESFVIKTSAYSIIVNNDSPISTNFYFQITKNAMLTDGGYKSPLVTVAFDYIPIEV